MKFKFQVLIYFLHSISCFSQWENMGRGLDDSGYDMLYDTSNNKLYVGGFFHFADSIKVNHIAIWDGFTWDSVGSGSTLGAPVYSIIKFQGKLFASSIFYNQSFDVNWLSWWNGQYWDTLTDHVNSAIKTFRVYNNELYFGGAFNKIGSQTSNLLAKFDGVHFNYFNLPSIANGYSINAIEFFQGDMYVGGNFYDTITGVNDLERWDGNSFQPFGGDGLDFGGAAVSSMVIYDNQLYIAGGFTEPTAGSTANNIMRWDGANLYNVGNGLNGGVKKMQVYNNELYVAGDFTLAGSVPANYLAKWNGSQWSEVCQSTFNNVITDFIIFNNQLIVSGGFTMIDSIPINHIGKYSLPIGIAETENEITVSVFPNPAIDKLKYRLQKFICPLCFSEEYDRSESIN